MVNDHKKNIKHSLGELEVIRLLENSSSPDWLAALEKLETDGDPTEIGLLLQQYFPPSWISKELGKMLAPPDKYRGAHLKVKLPARSRKKAFDELAKKIEAYRLILKYEGQGYKTEAAIAEVVKLTDYKRSTLFEFKRMDFEQEFNRIMGNQDESSKN